MGQVYEWKEVQDCKAFEGNGLTKECKGRVKRERNVQEKSKGGKIFREMYLVILKMRRIFLIDPKSTIELGKMAVQAWNQKMICIERIGDVREGAEEFSCCINRKQPRKLTVLPNSSPIAP